MFYGWYVVGACVAITMYYSGTIYLGFTTIFEPIAHEMGWTYAQISFAASLRGFEAGILAPIAGMILDRWGPRKLVFGGTVFTGLGLLLLSRIHSLIMFYLAFGLVCIGISSAPTGLLMSAVANWFRKHEGLAMGITASGVSLGGLLVPFVTSIVDTFGWRQAMIIVGLGVWAIPLPLTLLLRHKPEAYGYLPDGEVVGTSRQEDRPVIKKRGKLSVGAREALSSWVFWVVAAAFMCHVMSINAVATHIMPFFSSIGVGRSISRFIISAIPLIGIIGRVGFGWMGDRINTMHMATLALALSGMGVLMLMCLNVDRGWLIILFIAVFGIGWGGTVPMMTALVIKYFGRDRMGTIIGCINSVMMLGMITGAPLAGWIFDKNGAYQMAWLILGSILTTMTVIFFLLLHSYKK